MSEDVGGHGSKASNSIWLQYRAMKTNEKGDKLPLGKFTKGVKQDDGSWVDEEHNFVSGILQGASVRDNPGKPDKNVDPYTELVVTLNAVKNGEAYTYKLPFKAGSTAAFSLARRMAALTRGTLVEFGAFVKDGMAAVSVQKFIGQNKVAIPPVDTGVEFLKADGLTGAALKIARTQNEGLREEWVSKTVKALPYYEEWGQPTTHVAPVDDSEYSPFDDIE